MNSYYPHGVTLLPGEAPVTAECPSYASGLHHVAQIILVQTDGIDVACRCGWVGRVDIDTAIDTLDGVTEWEEVQQ